MFCCTNVMGKYYSKTIKSQLYHLSWHSTAFCERFKVDITSELQTLVFLSETPVFRLCLTLSCFPKQSHTYTVIGLYLFALKEEIPERDNRVIYYKTWTNKLQHGVAGSIPNSSNPQIAVSLSKTLNLKPQHVYVGGTKKVLWTKVSN